MGAGPAGADPLDRLGAAEPVAGATVLEPVPWAEVLVVVDEAPEPAGAAAVVAEPASVVVVWLAAVWLVCAPHPASANAAASTHHLAPRIPSSPAPSPAASAPRPAHGARRRVRATSPG